MPRTSAHQDSRRQPAPTQQTPADSSRAADFDAQLLLQARAGDRDAGNALVRRNFDRVARYIARVVRDRRVVEDLAQDTFLRVLRGADSYQPRARFSTWLYRIATRTALNHIHQASVRRQKDTGREVGEYDLPDRADLRPDRELSLDELRHRIAAAINALPGKQRVALTLFQYEELSYEQIAEVMDTSVEAVRQHLKRAREKLRHLLSELA